MIELTLLFISSFAVCMRETKLLKRLRSVHKVLLQLPYLVYWCLHGALTTDQAGMVIL
jgi:hypothetical protein